MPEEDAPGPAAMSLEDEADMESLFEPFAFPGAGAAAAPRAPAAPAAAPRAIDMPTLSGALAAAALAQNAADAPDDVEFPVMSCMFCGKKSSKAGSEF